MKKNIGENCTKNDECTENNCLNNKCFYYHGFTDFGGDCSNSSRCASLNCQNGKCTNGKFLNGDMCDDNRNCQSNNCVNWKCTTKVTLKIKLNHKACNSNLLG